SRDFRSLALPRMNSNIGSGSVQANHSASVISTAPPRRSLACCWSGSARPHDHGPIVPVPASVGRTVCLRDLAGGPSWVFLQLPLLLRQVLLDPGGFLGPFLFLKLLVEDQLDANPDRPEGVETLFLGQLVDAEAQNG